MPFINLKDVPSKEIVPGFSAKMIHSESMTLAYWTIEAGSVLPEHHHVHEQMAAHVISGELELTLEGETRVMKAGDIAIIPSNAVHSGRAVTDCQVLDVFNPVREDYK